MSIKILALDIETAPAVAYVWSAKTRYITPDKIVSPGYTMCWAAKWLDGSYMKFRSIHHHSETEMVTAMWNLLDEADAVLTYNGKRFDMPRLNAEFIKFEMPPPSPYKHIDLFTQFSRHIGLMHRGLDPVAKFLDLGEKIEHKGMDLWKECMAGDDAAWEVMRKYNKQDVQLLIDLYLEVLPWIKGHPNVAMWSEDTEDVKRCVRCGSDNIKKNGVEHTQVLTYQRYRCNDCGTPMKGRFAIAGRGNSNILKAA